jgi:hypothetical protein
MSNCLVTILNCSRASDLKRLKNFQKIEKEQNSHFTRFLTLNSDGCENKDLIYFIAVRPATFNEPQQLCGVAQTELSGINTVNENFLTSRAATDPNYKGAGTIILDAVAKFYKTDPRLFGINLTSVRTAVPFYLKYGFKQNSEDYSDMFYPFDTYYKFDHYDTKMRNSHIRLAVKTKDRDTLDEILYQDNLHLKDIVQTNPHKRRTDKKFLYLNEFLVDQYFNQLNIDGNTFSHFVDDQKYNIVIALLNRNKKFINYLEDDDVKKMIKHTRGRSLNEYIIALSDAGYQFNEELFKQLINTRTVNKEAIVAMYGNGLELTDTAFAEEIEEEYKILKTSFEALEAAHNILQKHFKL